MNQKWKIHSLRQQWKLLQKLCQNMCLQPCLDRINHHPTLSDQSHTPAFLLFVCWCVVIFLWFLLWLKIKDKQKANKTLRELFSFTDFCYQTLMLNGEVVRRKWRRSGEACAELRGKTHCMTDMVCNAYGILCLLFWPDTNGCWCQAV